MTNHCGEVSKHIMLYGDWVRDSFKLFVPLVRRKRANIKDVLVAGDGGCLLI